MTGPTPTVTDDLRRGRILRNVWRAGMALVMIAAVLGIVLAVWLISDDLERRGEFLDGLGVAIGVFLIVCCGFALLVTGAAMVLVSRYPQVSAWMSCVLLAPGGLILLSIWGNQITTQSLTWSLIILVITGGWIALCATSGTWPRRAQAVAVTTDQPVFPFTHRSTT